MLPEQVRREEDVFREKYMKVVAEELKTVGAPRSAGVSDACCLRMWVKEVSNPPLYCVSMS